MRSIVVALLILLSASSALAQSSLSVVFAPLVSGLAAPVDIAHAGECSGRLFIVEQAWRVRVVQNGQPVVTPFLDITARFRSGGEQGLLGLALHPRYRDNGQLLVAYTRTRAGDSGDELVLSRFTVAASAFCDDQLPGFCFACHSASSSAPLL
jgi:glucose/arabinose dehydrogenase